MSVLILNYLPHSSSVLRAARGLLEALVGSDCGYWLIQNATIKSTVSYYKILRHRYSFLGFFKVKTLVITRMWAYPLKHHCLKERLSWQWALGLVKVSRSAIAHPKIKAMVGKTWKARAGNSLKICNRYVLPRPIGPRVKATSPKHMNCLKTVRSWLFPDPLTHIWLSSPLQRCKSLWLKTPVTRSECMGRVVGYWQTGMPANHLSPG